MVTTVAEELAAPAALPHPAMATLPEHLVEPLVEHVQTLLFQRGFVREPGVPLSELHEHVPRGQQRLDQNYLNPVNISFYDQEPELQPIFEGIVRWCAELLGEEVFFQARPIFRFHFPGPFPSNLVASSGACTQHHSDTLGGHPFGMVQCWLALTPCSATSTLQVSDVEGGAELLRVYKEVEQLTDDEYRNSLNLFYTWVQHEPAVQERIAEICEQPELAAGDMLYFDPRCLHGGTANREQHTRVSMDLRLLTKNRYAQLQREGALRRFVRGDVLDSRSSAEL